MNYSCLILHKFYTCLSGVWPIYLKTGHKLVYIVEEYLSPVVWAQFGQHIHAFLIKTKQGKKEEEENLLK